MGNESHPPETLQIEENASYHRVFWVVQRAWWFALFVLLVLAILGLFGSGALSSTTAADGSLEVDYERFLRKDSANVVQVIGEASDGELHVIFDRGYIDSVNVNSIEPEPDSVAASRGEYRFTFIASGDAEEVAIKFQFSPNEVGRLRTSVSTPDGEVSLSQFVYP